MLVVIISKIPALNNLSEAHFQQEKGTKKSLSAFLYRVKFFRGKAKDLCSSFPRETFSKIKNLKNIKFTSWQDKEEDRNNLSDDYCEKIKKG